MAVTRTTTTTLPKRAKLFTKEDELKLIKDDKYEGDTDRQKGKIVWFPNVLWYLGLHVLAFLGLYTLLVHAMWKTWAFCYVMYLMNALGITAGAHRLWSHRTYSANLPYRIMLMLFNCVSLQNDVIEWSRDHRGHHKWSETDADPYNFNRGLFFCHVGWLMTKKRPEVIEKGRSLDLSDLHGDPVLSFQKRFYMPLGLLCCFGLPTIVPWLAWGESPWTAYLTAGVLRYVCCLHITWCVNSLAHWRGHRPYNKHINPAENLMTSLFAIGEGWHNFHHTFPHDYKAAELPYMFNFTTAFIDFFSLIGWTYKRKVVSSQLVGTVRQKYGE
jgi:stearoyl-CoA desaturase (delta-9 desaturase)